jgi:hypothetical protein
MSNTSLQTAAETMPTTTPTTNDIPPTITPDWDTVRNTVSQVRHLGRVYLYGQVWLGWQLSALKAGFSHGGSRRSSGQNVHLKTWAETVEAETGLQRKTADRLISLFEATKAKLKRVKGPIVSRGTLIVFETQNPLTATEEERGDIMDIIASLCDGETQSSLMQELGVISTPTKMPTGGGGGGKPDDKKTAGQLAFHFFDAVASPLVNARSNPDYEKMLYALPLYSSDSEPLSLQTLKLEAEGLLADIRKAEAAALNLKQTKGRTL